MSIEEQLSSALLSLRGRLLRIQPQADITECDAALTAYFNSRVKVSPSTCSQPPCATPSACAHHNECLVLSTGMNTQHKG